MFCELIYKARAEISAQLIFLFFSYVNLFRLFIIIIIFMIIYQYIIKIFNGLKIFPKS